MSEGASTGPQGFPPEPIRIARVKDKRGLRLFVEIGYRLHDRDAAYVPMPRKDLYELLDRKRHPFHQHAAVDYFLAFRGGRCVGRIAAIENYAHNQFHKERMAFFGFLDAEPEAEIFAALLGRVERWAAKRGLAAVRGPANFSTNEECAMLVDGFESPPLLMSPWNPESYPALVEQAGYAKAMDLYAFWSTTHTYNPRVERMADAIQRRLERRGDKLTARGLDMSRYKEEIQLARRIYNQAWEKNWGFVPMTEAEFLHMAKQIKPLIVPEIVRFMEINGEPAAFSLSLPDYNLPLRFMKGRMGLKQIALFLLMRKQIRQVRVMAMGVVEKFRNRGIEALLIRDTVHSCIDMGYQSSELGWTLETNDLTNRELLGIGAKQYKTFRFYEKQVGQ